MYICVYVCTYIRMRVAQESSIDGVRRRCRFIDDAPYTVPKTVPKNLSTIESTSFEAKLTDQSTERQRFELFRVVSIYFELFLVKILSKTNMSGGGGGREEEEEELIYTESRWRRQHYGDGISGNDVTQLRPFSVKIRRKERDATRSSACRSIVILDLIWKKRMVRPRETYERSRFNKTLRLSYIDTRLDGKDFITFIISFFI